MKKNIHSCSLFIVALLIIGLTGCSRTVTQYVTYGNEMVVEVTLRGTMDPSSNRYFLVLASKPDYKIPLPPPDNISYEFIEPGTEPRLGTAADYYANFYASWEGYCVVEPGGYFLADGPFVQGVAVTREVLASLGEISSKITFNFRLSQLFGTTVPSTLYFDFVTVPWPSDNSKLPADHLVSTNAYLSNVRIAGSTVTVSDEQNEALEAPLDILQCKLTIQ
jgi:hypothetical protein